MGHLFFLPWYLGFAYVAISLILAVIEIPIFRRIQNLVLYRKNTSCPHLHTEQTHWFAGECTDCGAQFGQKGQH